MKFRKGGDRKLSYDDLTGQTKKKDHPNSSRYLMGAGVGVGLLVLLGFMAWEQATILNWSWLILRNWPLEICILLITLVLGVVTFFWEGAGVKFVTGLLTVAGIISLIFVGYYDSYWTAREVNKFNTVTTADIASYKQRVPFVVADAQASAHMTTNGNLETTGYIPSSDHFSTVVAGRGWMDGYTEVVWQKVAPSGQTSEKNNNCSFTAHVPRFNGWFTDSLDRKIIHVAGFGTIVTQSDMYGTCEGKNGTTPMLYVPIKKLAGFPFTYQVPAGVVIINGDTGAVHVERNVKAGTHPGPVYPMSLAENQHQSTSAMGGFKSFIQGRVGYSATTDDDSQNSANKVGFNLAREDNSGSDYVTPLVLVGHATSISAVGVQESNAVTAGKLNTFDIKKLSTPRQSNSAMVSDIRNRYGYLPDWAANMHIFEIVPLNNKDWVATLGQSQAITYRVVIQPDQSSCLYDPNNNKKRCLAPDGSITFNSDTNTTNTSPSSSKPGSKTIDISGIDVSKLSNAQIAELMKRLADEAAKRMK